MNMTGAAISSACFLPHQIEGGNLRGINYVYPIIANIANGSLIPTARELFYGGFVLQDRIHKVL